jgi:hypothetical protein
VAVRRLLTSIVVVVAILVAAGEAGAATDAGSTVALSQTSFRVGRSLSEATITLVRTGSLAANASVLFTTSDGTATAENEGGGDYEAVEQIVTFEPGQKSATVTVDVVHRAVDLTFSVTLSGGDGAAVGSPSTATVTIAGTASVIGISGRVLFKNRAEVVRTGVVSGKVTVNYRALPVEDPDAFGKAVEGRDFFFLKPDQTTFPPGGTHTLVFPPGVTSVGIPVKIRPKDNVAQGTQTFTIELSGPGAGAVLDSARASHDFQIFDRNTFGGTVNFAAATASAFVGQSTTIKLVRAGGVNTVLSVDWAVIGGTAAPGTVAPASGRVKFKAGQSSTSFSVNVVSDGNAPEGTVVAFVPSASADGPTVVFGLTVPPGAAKLGSTNTSTLTVLPPPPPPVPQGSCAPSSSLSALVTGTDVISYVPRGSWLSGSTTSGLDCSVLPCGIAVVNVEGNSTVAQVIPTRDVVNSCASNSVTGQTVCTANGTDVYLLSGTTLQSALTSAGSSVIGFSGGTCTNCGVAMDAVNNRAVIGLSLAGNGGYQFLNLDAGTFEPAFASQAAFADEGSISENILIDPFRNLMLSPNESNNFELVDVTTTTKPQFFEQSIGGVFGVLDSAGEDCSTGIALAPAEGSVPSQLYIADLNQALFKAGAPGTWTDAGAQVQALSESVLSAGPSGIAVAQGTHIGVVSGEFGGDAITAIALPQTSGTGVPAISTRIP